MNIPKATARKKICNTRARARQLLFSDGNYITLVLAVLITAAAAVLSYMMAALVSEFTYSWVPIVMMVLLGFCVFAPMALGTVRVAVALYTGGENPLSELFFAFSSYGTYVKTLILVLLQTLKTLAVLGPTALTFLLINNPLSWYFPYLSGFWTLIAAVTATGVFILLDRIVARFYGTLFYAFADGEVNVIGGIRRSVKNCRGSFRRTVTFKLTALIFVLISILPLCMPLFFYTIPYLLCRYVYTMAHETDKEYAPITPNEEIIETGDISNEH